MSQEMVDPYYEHQISRIPLPELQFNDADSDCEEKDSMSQVTFDSHPVARQYQMPKKVLSKASDVESQVSHGTMDKKKSYYSLKSVESIESLVTEDLVAPRWTYLRGIGIVLLIVGMIEIGVGATAFRMIVNYKYGAWWAGMLSAVAGIFAILSPLHVNLTIIASIAVSPTLVSSVVGAVTDGYTANSVSGFESCARREGGTVYLYGQTSGSYATSALTCYNSNAPSDASGNVCVCVNDDFKCSPDLELFKSNDCSLLLDSYPNLLFSSTGICVCLCVLGLIGSIIACRNVWYKEKKERKVRRTRSMEKEREMRKKPSDTQL